MCKGGGDCITRSTFQNAPHLQSRVCQFLEKQIQCMIQCMFFRTKFLLQLDGFYLRCITAKVLTISFIVRDKFGCQFWESNWRENFFSRLERIEKLTQVFC